MNYIITGLICSGKSTFLDIAEKKGFQIIKSDDLVNQLYKTKKIIESLEECFEMIEFRDSPKAKIKELFFKSIECKDKIEKIIHPIVHKILLEELNSKNNLFIELPPIKANYDLIKNNKSIFIDSDFQNRTNRFEMLENSDMTYFNKINLYQNDYKLIKECCDIIIFNNHNIDALNKYFEKDIIKS